MSSFIDTLTGFDMSLSVLGNTLNDYIIAVGVFIVLTVVFKIIQWFILLRLAKFAEKTKTDIDDTFITIIRSLKPGFYYFIAFFLATKSLTFTALTTTVVNSLLLVWVVYQVIIALHILIDYALSKKARFDGGVEGQGMISMLGNIAKWSLWIVGGLLVLSNLGVNITSLVAGLGIGGLAIALALQNVLSDLFSSFSIYFDKPFQVGDYITTGKHSGTVEKIGIKSTRIRASQGEEIVISNQELTSARVQNFKKLKERRNTTSIGVTYETSTDKLKRIPGIIRHIIDEEKNARFNRVYFTTFADSALVFDLVYYVLSAEYSVYLETQQNINFKIKEAFEKEKIDMAYPTQTIYLAK